MSKWKLVALGDVVNLIGGGTPKRSEPDYWGGEIPWLSVKDFNDDGRFVKDSEEKITELGLEKSSTKILRDGQIIISARGTIGALAQVYKPMAFNQSCYGIDGKPEFLVNDFLYYLTKHSINRLKLISHGAVFDTITKDTFQHIDVNLPPLPEQKAIAHILGKLDDKIELNRQMNQTLEAMAQALFKSWFVDFDPVLDNALAAGNPIPEALQAMAEKRLQKFPSLQGGVSATGGRGGQAEAQSNAPKGQVGQTELQSTPPTGGQGGQAEHSKKANPSFEQTRPLLQSNPELAAQFPNSLSYNETLGKWIPEGWEVKSLDSVVKLDTSSVKPFDYPEKVFKHYSIPAFDDGMKPAMDLGAEIKSNKYQVKPGAILVSKLNPTTRRIWYVGNAGSGNYICSTEFIQMVPFEKEHSPFYYSLFNSDLFQNEIESTVTGSTGSRQRAQPKMVAKINLIHPSNELLYSFNIKASSLLKKQIVNLSETETLTQLRDTLLPQLISGRVRVPESMLNQFHSS